MKPIIVPCENAAPLEIGRRHEILVPFTCRLTELEGELDGIEEVAITIDKVGDVLGVVSVTFNALTGREVTSAAMRGVAVNNIMKNAVARHMRQKQLPKWINIPFGFDDEDRERFRALGPVKETLEAVAEVYEFGRITGQPPARQVEIQLGVPRTTASKWVRRAREEGYLGESDSDGQHQEAP